MASNRALKVETPRAVAARCCIGVLDNQPGAARDIVVLNAGAALYAANVVDRHRGGHRARRARRSTSGAAKAKLDAAGRPLSKPLSGA